MSGGIGQPISLITTSEVRYGGLLLNIDTEANTVSLSNVRMYGTEGRKKGIDELPASDTIYDTVVFRGSEVRDLSVYERTSLPDPAVVSAHASMSTVHSVPVTSQPPAPQQAPATRSGAGTTASGRGLYDSPSMSANLTSKNNNNNSNNHHYSNHHHGGNSNYNHGNDQFHRNQGERHYGGEGRGGYYQNRRGGGGYASNRRGGGGGMRGGGGGGGGGGGMRRPMAHTGQDFRPTTGDTLQRNQEEFRGEFDFEQAKLEFEKNKAEFEKAKADAKQSSRAYDKSSFFDTISCEPRDRTQGHRMAREDMKRADTETFGSDMVGSMRSFRRGRGGRGRFNRF